jgi:hypothetical protein
MVGPVGVLVRLALQFPLTLVEFDPLLPLLLQPTIAIPTVKRMIIPIDLCTSPPQVE